MAVIFLLGPGMWGTTKEVAGRPTPMDVRRRVARILGVRGHKVILMEEEDDQMGEDMIQKFNRLLRSKVSDVVLYWPPLAKMQTTYDELLFLYEREELLRQRNIKLWVLHHVSVAKITRDEFKVLEPGNRSRYLTAIARLGFSPLVWETDEELYELVRLLSVQLDA